MLSAIPMPLNRMDPVVLLLQLLVFSGFVPGTCYFLYRDVTRFVNSFKLTLKNLSV